MWSIAAIFCSASARAVAPAAQPSFACASPHCGMPARGAFPHLVVGRVVAVANRQQAQILLDSMRSRGRWMALPPSAASFWKHLQPVAINAGGDAVFIILTGRDEMRAAPLRVGDFVRYSPHRGRYETPPLGKLAVAYWQVGGCVAVLCRAGDRACTARYQSGVYRATDGVELAPRSLAPLAYGTVIDTGTMVPTHSKK